MSTIQRPINDAAIRACASEASILAAVLRQQGRRLKELFDKLYVELNHVDPTAADDRDFQRFMFSLARANGGLLDLEPVIHLGKELEQFRLPDPGRAGQPVPTDPVAPTPASATSVASVRELPVLQPSTI